MTYANATRLTPEAATFSSSSVPALDSGGTAADKVNGNKFVADRNTLLFVVGDSAAITFTFDVPSKFQGLGLTSMTMTMPETSFLACIHLGKYLPILDQGPADVYFTTVCTGTPKVRVVQPSESVSVVGADYAGSLDADYVAADYAPICRPRLADGQAAADLWMTLADFNTDGGHGFKFPADENTLVWLYTFEANNPVFTFRLQAGATARGLAITAPTITFVGAMSCLVPLGRLLPILRHENKNVWVTAVNKTNSSMVVIQPDSYR